MTAAAGWPPGRPRVLVTAAWMATAGDAAFAIATEGVVRDLAPEEATVRAA